MGDNEKEKIFQYDVVVIGAGNGGLIAATTTQKMGLKTLLVEQHNVPGGFASSFVRGRFEFEPALHELCDLGTKTLPGEVYKCFENLGIKVDWKLVPEAFRIIIQNDKGKELDATLPFGVEEFCNACEKYSQGSYKKVKKFLTICEELKDAVRYITETRGKPDVKVLKTKYPNFLTTSTYTLSEVLDKFHFSKITRCILEAYWVYLGVPPSRLAFSLFGIMMIEYIKYNAYIPTYRSHEISQAIATRFQELGGTIWFNTKATQIFVENNQVSGVQTEHGLIKTHHVISNASPHIVYGKMIAKNDIPKPDLNLVSWRKPGRQGYTFFLGLNCTLESLNLHDYSYFMYSSLNSDVVNNNMASLDKNCEYIVVALNNANKNASPEGTSIISFTTLFTDSWNDIDEKTYFKKKNEIARRMIKDFEKKMNIDITSHIEEIEVATPVTFARYTGSVNGAIYGYDVTPDDSTIVRSSKMDADATIKGLRFCGGGGFRAHGYSTTYLSGDVIGKRTFVDRKTELESKKGA